MKILILTALLAVLSCCRAEARDLHVDPGIGDDGNDGTTLPLKTIRHAIRSAEAGDTIHLKPAIYHEYAGFYNKRGEPGKPITLDGHGATLEGSDAIDPATWTEVSPGLFKNDELLPTLNLAILWRWFFLIDGKINHMGRVLKGKSEPFRKPEELKPGEWTFVGDDQKSEGRSDSDKARGSFFLKLKPGQTLKQANIRYPVRSAGVQLSGDNLYLRRTGHPEPAIVASRSRVTARHLTLDKLDLRVTGEMSYDACLINGQKRALSVRYPVGSPAHVYAVYITGQNRPESAEKK